PRRAGDGRRPCTAPSHRPRRSRCRRLVAGMARGRPFGAFGVRGADGVAQVGPMPVLLLRRPHPEGGGGGGPDGYGLLEEALHRRHVRVLFASWIRRAWTS